jgi:alpha,alpha-trehalase
MLDTDPAFRPIQRRDGYQPLEDLSLIGDGSTCALVGLDGAISWMCVPRFDSEPLFCGLLDCVRGGHFTIAPEEVVAARQRYEPDTAVLVTEPRCRTGLVQVTDALALRGGSEIADEAAADRAELVRSALVLEGRVRLRVEVEPLEAGGEMPAQDFGHPLIMARISEAGH